MIDVHWVWPVDAPSLEAAYRRLEGAPSFHPFDEPLVAFTARLSERLLRANAARSHPALQALGFWLRPAAIRRLKESADHRRPKNTIIVPRGLVFHIPPANVDTIFVYSWILSLLSGNRNVVRMPSRTSEQLRVLSTLVTEQLSEGGADVGQQNLLLSYGHDSTITEYLSGDADLRVIWGGDETIRTIRQVPLPARATELTFADRYSLAAFSAPAVNLLAEPDIIALAEQFFNDAYWFDQTGCSSPKLIAWCGSGGRNASARLFDALSTVLAAKGYAVDTGTALAKLSYLHREILDRDIARLDRHGNEIAELELATPAIPRGPGFGAGTFHSVFLDQLDQLLPHLKRRDQTLSYYGFDAAELTRFAVAANGRGIDRIVPVGNALSFDAIWDGYDLLGSFTRLVRIEP